MASLSKFRGQKLAVSLCFSVVLGSPCVFAQAASITTSSTDSDLLKPLTPVAVPVPASSGQSDSGAPASSASRDAFSGESSLLDAGKKNEHLTLSGHATTTLVKSELGKVVSEMLNKSLSANDDYNELEAEKNKKHPFKKVFSTVGTMLGEVVSINASAASKDGAKIAMDEDGDWDEKDALIYRQQKLIDDLHPKIAGALLQVAMGRGAPKQSDRSKDLTERGLAELNSLVGGQTRESINSTMDRWLSEVDSGPLEDAQSSDMIANRKHVKLLTEAAVCDDPVIGDIRKELKRTAKPNKVKDVVSNTLQTALDATAYTMPTGGIAAAVEVVKGVVVAATGGPEEDKLTHILYLLKRVESRRAALKEEIQQALYGKEVGVQTNNKLLIKCADAVVGNLVTPATVTKIEAEEARKLAAADEDDETVVEKEKAAAKLAAKAAKDAKAAKKAEKIKTKELAAKVAESISLDSSTAQGQAKDQVKDQVKN